MSIQTIETNEAREEGNQANNERILRRYRKKVEGGLFGVSENHVFGPDETSHGYERARYSVAKISGNGTCGPARWLHDVDTDPKVQVHTGVPVFGWVEFDVLITEAPKT